MESDGICDSFIFVVGVVGDVVLSFVMFRISRRSLISYYEDGFVSLFLSLFKKFIDVAVLRAAVANRDPRL